MMGADMKETIADTTRRLLMKKRRGKLTVTEIVEECNITRQAFYYHFEDVPALIRWILEKDEEKMIREALAQQNAEQGLLYLFRMASAITPYIQRGMRTNYREELQKLLLECCQRFMEKIAEKEQLYPDDSYNDRKLFIRYQSYAMMGLLQNWTEEDTQNMEMIAHSLHRLMIGEVTVQPDPLTK